MSESRPALSTRDAIQLRATDTKLGGKRSHPTQAAASRLLGADGVKPRAQFRDQIWPQLAIWVVLTVYWLVAPLAGTVKDVFGVRTRPQMVWPDAGRIIAVVTDVLPGRDRAEVEQVGRPVCHDRLPAATKLPPAARMVDLEWAFAAETDQRDATANVHARKVTYHAKLVVLA
jgi:hypothetical protein